jgi:hypothetical protein
MSTRLLLHITVFTLLLLSACTPQLDLPSNPISPEETEMSPTDSTSVDPPQDATSVPAVATPDSLQKKMTDLAIADLASRLSLDLQLVTVKSAESITWPNSALGCPQPDKVYAQGLVPGFRIKLLAGGTEYVYHTDRNGTYIQCLEGNSNELDVPTTPIRPGDTLGGQIQ